MITLENLAAFVLGLAVVYFMSRIAGFIVLLGLILVLQNSAMCQEVSVTNWPTTNNPLPVYQAQETSTDVWPSASAGFAFGLTCLGFGIIFRTARKTGNDVG